MAPKRWLVVNETKNYVWQTNSYWLAKLSLWLVRNDKTMLIGRVAK